jgi:urea transport system ATP-binding protein
LLRLTEAEIANKGIGRKFQKPTVFEAHSVRSNLELALPGRRSLWRCLVGRPSAEQVDRVDEMLGTVGLLESADRLAGELSHGQKQWLEIGMLLIQDPALILLDEPVAGMTDAETDRTAALIMDLRGKHSMMVVEHDMEFVAKIAHRVTVLHEGSVLAEGSLSQVQSDSNVVEVYLGR